ncbi:MAG: tRNA uridine-5-carboxymethylaminomethyl(34) synthesis GTPase MnmE [Spirochaetia bacterium]|nr:tRNA uridine-5-carboxymethylaminomethyl(34) synthesis GTPase MnmE [Spirochaetia bacterium]
MAAIATYPAESALGIVRISGQSCLAVLNSVFKPSGSQTPMPGKAAHGIISDSGGAIDEVMVTFFRGPRSYTAEDMAEISCHGNPYILSRVMELLLEKGARPAGPGEFTMRAFLNGRLDLSQAEAVADLISARNPAALSLSLRQLSGAEKEAIVSLRSSLMTLLAMIEAEIDFEHEGSARAGFVSRAGLIAAGLEEMIKNADSGILLKEGIRAAITGTPNAGKSSLLNAILGRERAIVTHIPGTTRDTIEEHISVDGVRFKFIDTAGIRESSDPIEIEGIKRAKQAVSSAHIAIFTIDGSRPVSPEDLSLYRDINSMKHLIAINKSDLPCAFSDDTLRSLPGFNAAAVLHISCKTGEGINTLTKTVKDIIIGTGGLKPSGDIIISSLRHKQRAEAALMELNAARTPLLSVELKAEHVRAAIRELGSIIGAVADDEILTEIFKNFCVGK